MIRAVTDTYGPFLKLVLIEIDININNLKKYIYIHILLQNIYIYFFACV